MCKSKSYLALRKSTAGFPGGTMVEAPPANAGDTGDAGSIPGLGRLTGGGNSSILAWEIPRTEEPGRLQPTGSPRAEHNWATEYTYTQIYSGNNSLQFLKINKNLITCSHVTCLHGELLTDTKDILLPRSPPDHLSAMPERMGTTTGEDCWVTLCQVLLSEFSKRYSI